MPINPESEVGIEILKRLASRKLGVKLLPLPPTSSPASLDVEDAYSDTVLTQTKPNTIAKVESAGFESEPE
jgi:hypothetical protein